MCRKKIILVGGEDVSLRIPAVIKLIKMGYNIVVVGSEPSEAFTLENFKYHCYDLRRNFTPLSDIKTIYQLYKIFKYELPDVVHTFDTKPNILACIAAWLAGVPRIIKTLNGMGGIFTDNSLRNRIFSQLYSLAQYFTSKILAYTIFQNNEDREFFISRNLIPSEKAKLILGSGINVQDFVKTAVEKTIISKHSLGLDNENRCVVLLVARMIEAKGVLEYLEAAKILSNNKNEYRFFLVGSIESGVGSISLSKINEYSNVCEYLGYRTDIAWLMSQSSIIVLPTYCKEGLPRTLLEGATLEKPLIATNVGGCKDIVINEHNGMLVKAKCSRSLASAVQHLASNPKLCQEMGANGRRLVEEKFSLNKVCKSWSSLY